jgi:hypothetical protein
MESSGPRPPDPEVPLGDAAIAAKIATAAARGRGADRAPTLQQLLAAFGEPAVTPAAQRRVAAALRVAGLGARPDVLTAEPGQRLLLLPPGSSGGRSRGRALVGIAGLAAVLVVAAVSASLLKGSDGNDRAADSLPSETSTFPSTAVPASTATAPETTTAPTVATSSTATPTTTATVPATTTTTTTADDDAEKAAERRRRRAARVRRERAAAQKAAAKKRSAHGHTGVTVRVDSAGKPTFLCVDNGHGTTLFSGTLTGKQVFRAKRIRMNIGLKSTFITVNGNPVRLEGSPAGLDITRKDGARTLASGKRPCA